MNKEVVEIKPTLRHGKGYWIVPYYVKRGSCGSCPPFRMNLIFKQEDKPTQIQIKNKLITEGYEIKN